MADKFIRIFDRNHNLLDELYRYNNLKYGWTLNDIDTLEIEFALDDPKCTPINMQFANHLELIDENNNIVWGGIIFSHNYNDTILKINCLDYNALLKYRRLRAKQYPKMQYGTLMQQMILDCESARPDHPIGITIGNIANGALKTTREVKNTDFLWSKIKEFGDDANYDYGVDVNRAFNFWLRRGADKLQYLLEWGGERDNIIVSPTLSRDIMSLENSVYAESTVSSADGSITLTSLAENTNSQSQYGLFEGIFSPSEGVSIQSTLDIQTNGELQRSSIPADSISFTAKDSTLCPFNDLEVGDRVMLHLIPYFDYSASVRILRMCHDEKTQTREFTVGSIIFKPQKPYKRLYKG